MYILQFSSYSLIKYSLWSWCKTRKHILFVLRYRTSKFLLISLGIGLFLLTIRFSSALTSLALAPLKQRVIVIDPGHGGIDGGTNCPGFLEKDINLSIARKLKAELQKNGAKVILTRERDTDLHNQLAETMTRHRKDLLVRINIIKNSKPDLFISLHVNSNPRRPTTTGPMVFYNRRVPASLTLAETVQEHLNTNASLHGFQKHSAHSAEYYLLNNCPVPGVLVELGFITNYREQQMLKKDDYQMSLAKTLVSSIVSYFKSKHGNYPIKEPASIVSASDNRGLVAYFPQKDSDTLAAKLMFRKLLKNGPSKGGPFSGLSLA